MKTLRPERARKFAYKLVANGFNATQAVIDYQITDNRNSAHVIGHRLLRNATTIRAVEDHLQKSKISADEVLEELSILARAPVEKVSEAGKLKALELSGKAHKLFVDKVETEDKTPLSPDTLQTLKALAKQLSGQDLTDSQVKQLMADSFARAEKPIDGGEA